ncbi:MAG: Fe-S cluster assembly protein SufD [Candidatus Sumerlaeaceae bacterium]
MTEATGPKTVEQFASAFDQLESKGEFHDQNGLKEVRRSAINRFSKLGLPNTRQEDWRFTSVAPLAQHQFQVATPGAQADLDGTNYKLLSGLTSIRMVFVNGFFSAELSKLDGIPSGVTVGSLQRSLEARPPAIERYLTKLITDPDHPFVALNTAMFQDGAYVHVLENAVIEEPIHLLFLATSPAGAIVSHPRNLIVAERHSQATIVETYAGVDGEIYLTNAVTEVAVAQDAVIDHYRYQQESRSAFHFNTLEIKQERASNFSTQAVTFGGGLVRNDISFTLAGEGCLSTMNGLYQIGGKQHVDNHTRIDHAHPRCESHEFYKGILDGQARGVFNGKIMVRQIAQKTNAKQTNRNLLLSQQALINTNPQLEIFADDVKCTHGATIGQLDKTQLYYLRARGIPMEEARRILTYAFANDVVEKIKLEPLRVELERQVLSSQAVQG